MNIQNKLVVLTITLIGALSFAGCDKAGDKAPAPAPSPAAETTVGTDIDDGTITTKVKAALLADDDIKSFDIKVETRKGEVHLSGFVDNQGQIDRAMTVARGIEGVKDVDNKMSVKTTETTVGEKIDDGIITTKVKAELIGESGLNSTDISAVTRDGVVQLSGFVDDQAQIDRAGDIARAVEGVTSVVNELSIKE